MCWETVVEKFDRLSAPYADAAVRGRIAEAVAALESIEVSDLVDLLTKVRATAK
jgi:2-methylcitrate dehydratase